MEGRARGGGWTFLVLAALALGVFALVNLASSSSQTPPLTVASSRAVLSPAPQRPPVVITTQPLVSARLVPRAKRGAGAHCEAAGCCPTRVSTFGTQADITRVIASFQHRGFQYAAPPLVAPVSGDPRTSGTYLRWLGELPGNTTSWRLVNVATGAMNRFSNWKTVFEVSKARCGTR